MQIKRFEAKNMTDALRQIKRELGAEAVILSATDIRKENRLLGISRKVGVEVTAAVDGGLSGQMRPGASANAARRPTIHEKTAPMARSTMSDHLRDDVQDIVKLGGLQCQSQPARTKPTSGMAPRSTQWSTGTASMPNEDSTRLVKSAAAKQDLIKTGREDWQQQMHKRLSDGGLEIMPWPFMAGRSHLVALVGSAGVGKTTTIAKLAARLHHEEGRRVGLISLDREKIGGIEQLQIYADILRIPLEIPQTGKDLKKAVKKLAACDVVLVDTPAIGASRAKRPAVFDEQLRQIAKLQVWLVIGADNQVANMQSTAAIGEDLEPSAVIITKTDLSLQLGGVMQFLSTVALPVVCLSNGPDVPSALVDPSLDLFARLLMQTGRSYEDAVSSDIAAGDLTPEGQYLANRNSDIFHRPGCKWIRLINKENIVMFGSFADALNNRFKPCRYCNPQHMSITGILNQERAAR